MHHGPRNRILIGLTGALATVALLGAPAQAAAPTTRWVDDDGHAGAAGCGAHASAFKKVQKAVDASAAHDIVVVCPGVYVEAVSITAPRTGLVLRAATPLKAVIEAPSGSANPIILIGANHVAIRDLTIRAKTNAVCSKSASGVAVDGTSNTLMVGLLVLADPTGNTVGPCGLDRGIDIFDGGTATIRRTVIRDFQSDGVRVKDGGSSVEISNSSIEYLRTGDPCAAFCAAGTRAPASVSPAGVPSRNGVSVQGATALVTGTSIRSGPSAHDGVSQLAAGILSLGATLTATDNVIRRAAWGIDVESSTGASIRDNDIRGGLQYGIIFAQGTGAQVLDNRTTNNGISGIALNSSSTGNVLRRNDARGNSEFDCIDATGPSGSGTAGTQNTWHNNKGDDDSPSGICPHP